MVFKSVNGFATKYLSSKLTSRSDTTPYTFRDSKNSGSVLWNSLPQNVRQSESLNIFTKRLNDYHMNNWNHEIHEKQGLNGALAREARQRTTPVNKKEVIFISEKIW